MTHRPNVYSKTMWYPAVSILHATAAGCTTRDAHKASHRTAAVQHAFKRVAWHLWLPCLAAQQSGVGCMSGCNSDLKLAHLVKASTIKAIDAETVLVIACETYGHRRSATCADQHAWGVLRLHHRQLPPQLGREAQQTVAHACRNRHLLLGPLGCVTSDCCSTCRQLPACLSFTHYQRRDQR